MRARSRPRGIAAAENVDIREGDAPPGQNRSIPVRV